MKYRFAALLLALMLLSACGTVPCEPAAGTPEPTPNGTPASAKELATLAVIEIPSLESYECTTLLGTAENYTHIQDILSTLTPDSLTEFTCSINTDFKGRLELSAEDSRALYDQVLALEATIKEEWSNPPTGGGWSVILGNAEHTLTISFNGEWLCYGIKEEKLLYIFNADDLDVGYAIDTLLWQLTEDALKAA